MDPVKFKKVLLSTIILSWIVCLFAPLVVYTLVCFVLLFEHFTMLGGTLIWLNSRLEDNFEDTASFRRMVATDTRLLTIGTFATLVFLFHLKYVASEANFVALCFKFEYIDALLQNRIPSIVEMTESFLRLLLFGHITHSIHSLLLYEKLAGLRVTHYPFLIGLKHRLIQWSKQSMKSKK